MTDTSRTLGKLKSMLSKKYIKARPTPSIVQIPSSTNGVLLHISHVLYVLCFQRKFHPEIPITLGNIAPCASDAILKFLGISSTFYGEIIKFVLLITHNLYQNINTVISFIEKRIQSNMRPFSKELFLVFNDFSVENHCRYSDNI